VKICEGATLYPEGRSRYRHARYLNAGVSFAVSVLSAPVKPRCGRGASSGIIDAFARQTSDVWGFPRHQFVGFRPCPLRSRVELLAMTRGVCASQIDARFIIINQLLMIKSIYQKFYRLSTVSLHKGLKGTVLVRHSDVCGTLILKVLPIKNRLQSLSI
jgi:hypothetical protein